MSPTPKETEQIVQGVLKLLSGLKLTRWQVDRIIVELNQCLGGQDEGNESSSE